MINPLMFLFLISHIPISKSNLKIIRVTRLYRSKSDGGSCKTNRMAAKIRIIFGWISEQFHSLKYGAFLTVISDTVDWACTIWHPHSWYLESLELQYYNRKNFCWSESSVAAILMIVMYTTGPN